MSWPKVAGRGASLLGSTVQTDRRQDSRTGLHDDQPDSSTGLGIAMKLRTRNCLLSGAFFALGAFVGGAAYSAIKVFYFGDVEPKFSNVADLAFQLDLAGVLVLAMLGAAVLALSTLVWGRLAQSAQEEDGSRLGLIALLGSLYWPVLNLIGKLIEQVLPRESWSNTIAVICVAIAYPLIVGFVEKYYSHQS